MKKAVITAVFTTVLALFTSGLSYAAPARQNSVPVTQADTKMALTPQLAAQAITELKTAGIPHETVKDAEGVKTTFHAEQGLLFTLAEPRPSVSAFLWGGWDFGGPYVLFNGASKLWLW